MRRLKIAMIDPSLFTPPYDTALADALQRNGCDVKLYARKQRPGEPPDGAVPVTDFFYRRSERLRDVLPGPMLRAVKGVEHVIDMTLLKYMLRVYPHAPDIVHFQWAPVPMIDRRFVAALDCPAVLTVHDITPYNGSGRKLQTVGLGKLLPVFGRLIVHSESSKKVLIDHGIDDERVHVIPHGVIPLVKSNLAKLPVTDGRQDTTIVMFGKIKSYKGVDVMIEALAKVPEQLRRSLKVLIVGEPVIPVEPMQMRATELGVAGCLQWDLRFIDDAEIDSVLSLADIFAFPYRDIDASGVFMSCLPYGKPIIASKIGAFATLLKDGEHGFLVAPGDSTMLAASLTTLLKSPYLCETYGRNVAAIPNAVPSWDEIAQRTIACYESLAWKGDVAAKAA